MSKQCLVDVETSDGDRSILTNHLSSAKLAISSVEELIPQVVHAAQKLHESLLNNGTIYAFGNGGSACQAMHFAEELVARYKRERPGMKAMHFCDGGVLSCWSNDYCFEDAFARQVQAFAKNGDAVLAFSTSGNSENVLRGLQAAKEQGVLTVGLLGGEGGRSLALCDVAIVVPASDTPHIQEAHLMILHMLCELLERKQLGI